MIERVRAALDAGDALVCDFVESFAFGTSLRTPSLPSVYQLNTLRVEAEASAEEIAREADRWQDGFPHRKAIVRDERLAGGLREDFTRRGWEVERVAVMVWEGGDPLPDAGTVRELERAKAERLRESFYRAHAPLVGEAELRQLLQRDERFTRAFAARELAAPAQGPLHSGCRLLAHGALAEVDFVETHVSERGHGLGRAVVLTAVATALAAGHEEVFLQADSDDWTAGWYERLGFRSTGLIHELTRLPDRPRP